MPQERIQETRRLSEEAVAIIQQTAPKSPEQLIEVIEDILRHLKRTERINEDKNEDKGNRHGYDPIFLSPPPFV